MEWDKSALEGLERVPFFVRKMARKKVEDYARQHGREKITLSELEEARQEMMGGASPESKPSAPEELREGNVAIPVGEIRRIERAMAENASGHEKPCYSVKLCGGAMGCPMTQIDVKALGDRIAASIEESGLAEVISGRINGPILTHHKLRVAVAGCPNACSEPQIKDFGIIGRSRPAVTVEPCIECMACKRACRENAVNVADCVPSIDYDTCVNCGMCIAACPTGTLEANPKGQSILVGGRLGRHPKLAETIAEIAGDEAVIRALESCISLIKTEGRRAERLGALLERIGTESIRKQVL